MDSTDSTAAELQVDRCAGRPREGFGLYLSCWSNVQR